ncbi:MAG: riboflavin synthase [Gemmatimonadota bacterium]|nr:riboflavin synthase [Gemmatimonadota bacterium]
MFNGIIEYIGAVSSVSSLGRGKTLTVESGHLVERMKPGDSMAVNGVCITVTGIKDTVVELEAAAETLSKTNLGLLHTGSRVNIERSLQADARVHGHWVAGHVDATSRVVKVLKGPESTMMSFGIDDEIRPFLVPRGSVAVDGVSLTVARLESSVFTCSLVGFTLSHTTLGMMEKGSLVNIETDVIGKYVVSTLERMGATGGSITEEKMRGWGF